VRAGVLPMAWACAVLTLVAIVALPTRTRGVAGPVLLAVSVVCLGVIRAQARRLRTTTATPAADSPASAGLRARLRPRRYACATGGPCDGQRLAVGRFPEPVVWLANPPGPLAHYRLDPQTAGRRLGPAYRYTPAPHTPAPHTPAPDTAAEVETSRLTRYTPERGTTTAGARPLVSPPAPTPSESCQDSSRPASRIVGS